MQTKFTPEITELIDESTHRPAVSIILSIEATVSTTVGLQHKLKGALDSVSDELLATYPKALANKVMERLHAVVGGLQIDDHKKAIAIFVSPEFQKVLYLDIPVRDRVVVNQRFEIRELVHNLKEGSKYLVVLLSSNKYKVYQGSTAEFLKIISQVGESVQDGRDIGHEPVGHTAIEVLKDTEMDKFLHQVDKEVERLIAHDHRPVFVLGTKKILGHFKKITKNSTGIVGYITGNYDRVGFVQLQKLLEPHLLGWKHDKQETLLTILDQAASQRKLATGITAVTRAALNKKGQRLIVESDFVHPIQPTVSDSKMALVENNAKGKPSLPDAVDDIIANVILSGGDVDFTDHGALDKYKRIALVTY
jgi:hypothetical protein